MKRKTALIMSTMLSLGLLAGCSGGGNTQAESTGGGSGTEPAAAQSQAEGNGSSGEASVEQQGVSGTTDETLTIAMTAEPATLMPSASAAKESGVIVNCMAETLVKWDSETGEILPNLADYEWVDDTHFRVTLKEGIYFQNGEELTTEDVLYTFQVKSQLSGGGFTIYNLDATEIEDDYNMIFETDGIWVQAPERFCQDNYTIMSKKTLEAMGGAENTELYPAEGYGTGPYTFKEWVQGQYILLERNDNYWNEANAPYYKYMKFVFVNDAAARAMAVESGDANVGMELPTSQGQIYEGNDAVSVHYLDTMLTGGIYLNCDREGLNNELVREAIWNLVDVKALNQLTGNGLGKECQTTISPYSAVYDPEPEGTVREVNIEKAKELLAEAGYGDGLTLEMTCMAVQQPQCEIIQENLRQGGITVNLTVNETPTHFDLLRSGDYDMAITDLSPMYYTENLRLVDGRISTDVVAGGCNYKDENFYPLLDTAYNAFDMDERIKAYKDCQDYMKEHYVFIGTNTTVKMELTTAGLTCPGLTGTGWEDFTQVRPAQ